MAVYLVAYDLLKEKAGTHDYEPLWNELKRLGAHKTQYSLWLVNLNDTPRQVVDHFKRFTDENDRILVSQVNPRQFWYVNAIAGTNDWLSKNLGT